MDSQQYPTVRERSAWWRWRHARPFWGGLFVTLAGAEILFVVKAPLPVVLHVGMQGLAGYLVPMVLLLCGILLLFSPGQRLFYSIIAALLSLASWLTSNLGGFVFGMLLGLVGSALAFAWSPDRKPRPTKAPVAPAPPPGHETPNAVASWMAGPSAGDRPADHPTSPSAGLPPENRDPYGRHRHLGDTL